MAKESKFNVLDTRYNILDIFGKNLNDILKSKDMDFRELSYDLRVYQKTAEAWVCCECLPRPKMLGKLCDLLNIKPADLFKI